MHRILRAPAAGSRRCESRAALPYRLLRHCVRALTKLEQLQILSVSMPVIGIFGLPAGMIER